jgi:hypothetical protein
MYCQHCGTQVHPGQSYCGACAKPLAGYGMAQRHRMEDHVRLLGIFWIVYSVFVLAVGAAAMIVSQVVFGHNSRFASGAPGFLYPLLTAVAIILLVKSFACMAAGFGLLRHEEWAPVLAIVLAFFALLHVPLGTFLGAYTIWALLPRDANDRYQALAQPA